jgi:hypothetical protein
MDTRHKEDEILAQIRLLPRRCVARQFSRLERITIAISSTRGQWGESPTPVAGADRNAVVQTLPGADQRTAAARGATML